MNAKATTPSRGRRRFLLGALGLGGALVAAPRPRLGVDAEAVADGDDVRLGGGVGDGHRNALDQRSIHSPSWA
jgi:isoquinoline 1-oxidoreductase beta subunit